MRLSTHTVLITRMTQWHGYIKTSMDVCTFYHPRYTPRTVLRLALKVAPPDTVGIEYVSTSTRERNV